MTLESLDQKNHPKCKLVHKHACRLRSEIGINPDQRFAIKNTTLCSPTSTNLHAVKPDKARRNEDICSSYRCIIHHQLIMLSPYAVRLSPQE